MLLVVWAETAVVGAATLGMRLQDKRPVAGLEVVVAETVVGGVGGDEHLLCSMCPAPLDVEHTASFDDDLGGHQSEAFAAE
jgi:hypothetical protein